MDTLTTLIYAVAVAVVVTLDVAAVTLGRNPAGRAPRRTRRKG